MSAIILAGRCNWCSRQFPPSDLLSLTTGQVMCHKCYEWHHHALEVLSGAVPRGCQECGVSIETLNGLSDAPTTRMYIVVKDGIYQVLCLTCKETYCVKRADLFKGTRFGEQIKL